jgi:hypothetical protein
VTDKITKVDQMAAYKWLSELESGDREQYHLLQTLISGCEVENEIDPYDREGLPPIKSLPTWMR